MRMSIDSSRALQPAQIPACHRTGGHQSRSRREPIVNLILALAVAAINDRPQRSHDAPLLGQSAGRFEIERVFPTSEDETPLRHTKSLGSEGDRGTRVITTLLLVRRPGWSREGDSVWTIDERVRLEWTGDRRNAAGQTRSIFMAVTTWSPIRGHPRLTRDR